MFVRSALLCICLLGSAVSLRAQSMPENVKKSLDKLVGTWEITTMIDDRKVKERVKLGWVNDESVLVYQGEGENFRSGTKVRFSGMLGWDPVKKTVEESGFDTSGGTFKADHKITDEKWIGQMTATGIVDGAAKVEKSTREFVFEGKDRWIIVCTDRVLDGVKQSERKHDFRRVDDETASSQAGGCPWEWMLGDWKVERSDGTSAKVNWRLPEGAVDYLLGTWQESDGAVLHEIVGWEADKRELVAHGFGANGVYYAVRCHDVKKHQMTGVLRSRNAKGESQVGVIELERVSEGKATSRFTASDGTVVTEVLTNVGK